MLLSIQFFVHHNAFVVTVTVTVTNRGGIETSEQPRKVTGDVVFVVVVVVAIQTGRRCCRHHSVAVAVAVAVAAEMTKKARNTSTLQKVCKVN